MSGWLHRRRVASAPAASSTRSRRGPGSRWSSGPTLCSWLPLRDANSAATVGRSELSALIRLSTRPSACPVGRSPRRLSTLEHGALSSVLRRTPRWLPDFCRSRRAAPTARAAGSRPEQACRGPRSDRSFHAITSVRVSWSCQARPRQIRRGRGEGHGKATAGFWADGTADPSVPSFAGQRAMAISAAARATSATSAASP